jgi:hypothetical protein
VLYIFAFAPSLSSLKLTLGLVSLQELERCLIGSVDLSWTKIGVCAYLSGLICLVTYDKRSFIMGAHAIVSIGTFD